MSDNPFTYYRKPETVQQAQSNINHWWYIKMGGCPEGEIEANWKSYIREMERGAHQDMDRLMVSSIR